LVGVLDPSISFFGTVNGTPSCNAVSDSSDPTQDTTGDGKAFTEMHSINMTENVAAGTVFADYPRIGWNSDGYYVTFNMFTTGFFNTYDHVSVISIDKTAATDWNNATAIFTHTNVPGGITPWHARAGDHARVHRLSARQSAANLFRRGKADANGNPTSNALTW